jgi:hypothetical protein
MGAWIRVRPLALNMYGAMRANAKQLLQQLSQRHSEANTINVNTRKGLGLQTISVVLQAANARMILSRRPHPPEGLAPNLLRRASYRSYKRLSVETLVNSFCCDHYSAVSKQF